VAADRSVLHGLRDSCILGSHHNLLSGLFNQMGWAGGCDSVAVQEALGSTPAQVGGSRGR
jgi:hypothetical protein